MKDKLEAVKTFHEAFGLGVLHQPTANLGEAKNLLRYKLMREENEEYLEAAQNDDLEEVADALGLDQRRDGASDQDLTEDVTLNADAASTAVKERGGRSEEVGGEFAERGEDHGRFDKRGRDRADDVTRRLARGSKRDPLDVATDNDAASFDRVRARVAEAGQRELLHELIDDDG